MKEIDWSGAEVNQHLVEKEMQNLVVNMTTKWDEIPETQNKIEYKISTLDATYSFFICKEGYLWLSINRQTDDEEENTTLICNESINNIDRIIKNLDKNVRKL